MNNNCKSLERLFIELKKSLKKKGDKLHVKQKVYYNLFNSWIDKSDIL